ncbi:hypothetical protein BDR04DRAFT_1103351 [Suillus decipiens]|nr:hypothetical protein BDR04DRAFT_1103351 [Suillus decipiens]
MVAKILIMLLAFAVYTIAAPHSTRQNVGGANYVAIGVEEEPVEAEVLTPSANLG